MATAETSALIKPFTAVVNSNGQATLNITHSLHGISWIVYQIGFALGMNAPSPQVAAHVNGTPLAATVSLQPSVFGSLAGQAPYAMESFFVGPPYINLEAGDMIVCGMLGATPGDVFTAAAYINEIPSQAAVAAQNAQGQETAAYVARPGMRRW